MPLDKPKILKQLQSIFKDVEGLDILLEENRKDLENMRFIISNAIFSYDTYYTKVVDRLYKLCIKLEKEL
jgi:hypothetical protein